jgi:hypothetical protein
VEFLASRRKRRAQRARAPSQPSARAQRVLAALDLVGATPTRDTRDACAPQGACTKRWREPFRHCLGFPIMINHGPYYANAPPSAALSSNRQHRHTSSRACGRSTFHRCSTDARVDQWRAAIQQRSSLGRPLTAAAPALHTGPRRRVLRHALLRRALRPVGRARQCPGRAGLRAAAPVLESARDRAVTSDLGFPG